MSPFLEQVFAILTAPPGNLVYHLVLIFSLAAAFQAAFHHWRASEFPQVRRALVGLGLLLLAHLLLFAVSAAGWQALFDPARVLPPLDRAITALGLVWVIWLWAFPDPGRFADAAAALLSLFLLTGLALSLATWSNMPAGSAYNASLHSLAWTLVSLTLIALGAIVIVLRRPSGWANGVAFLGLSFLGQLISLFGETAGDYQGAVRLAALAAYPLLLTLPQRYPSPAAAPAVPSAPTRKSGTAEEPADRRRYTTDPKAFHALLTLASEIQINRVSQAITRAIAQTMLADLCFLFYLSEDKNQLILASGYDLIREESLEGTSVDKSAIPLLANAIQRGRPLRLPASGTSPDLKGLGDLLGLASPGHLLSAPIMTAQKESLGGVLLLSPYSNRMWSAEDQAFLMNITAALVPIIQRGQRMAALEAESGKARQALEELQARLSELEGRNRELTEKLEAAEQSASQDRVTAENLAALLAVQEEAQRTIQQLQQENQELRAALAGGPMGVDVSHYEAELRATLREVASLQNQLAEANMKILELQKRPTAPATSEQAEVIASISQELRQPMSSIIGYTDLLLGESVGILGALQRKFVERIKASTERIGALIDDLIQITTLESGLAELKPEAVDLNLIIDNAMAYTSSQVREKNLSLELDIPRNMPPIQADREALQQILIHLLQNAGAATPMDGVIRLKVQTQTEGGQQYIMIQVTDSGGGIPPEDINRVFSRLYRADNVLIQGVGDTGVGLSIARTLTEAQHGRIWVESEPGVGATFSVLLPIAGTPAPSSGP